jgi:hypothetical protein
MTCVVGAAFNPVNEPADEAELGRSAASNNVIKWCTWEEMT